MLSTILAFYFILHFSLPVPVLAPDPPDTTTIPQISPKPPTPVPEDENTLTTGDKWIIGIGSVVSVALIAVIAYSLYVLFRNRRLQGNRGGSSSSSRAGRIGQQLGRTDQATGDDYYNQNRFKRAKYADLQGNVLSDAAPPPEGENRSTSAT